MERDDRTVLLNYAITQAGAGLAPPRHTPPPRYGHMHTHARTCSDTDDPGSVGGKGEEDIGRSHEWRNGKAGHYRGQRTRWYLFVTTSGTSSSICLTREAIGHTSIIRSTRTTDQGVSSGDLAESFSSALNSAVVHSDGWIGSEKGILTEGGDQQRVDKPLYYACRIFLAIGLDSGS